MNLSIAKHFAVSTLASRQAVKLAAANTRILVVDGFVESLFTGDDIALAVSESTGYTADEWMADMLFCYDPFTFTAEQQLSWSNHNRYRSSLGAFCSTSNGY